MARFWLFGPRITCITFPVLLLAYFAQPVSSVLTEAQANNGAGHLDHHRVLDKRQVSYTEAASSDNGTTNGPGPSHPMSTTGLTLPEEQTGSSVEQSPITASDGLLSTNASSYEVENTTLPDNQSIRANGSLPTTVQDNHVNGTETLKSNKPQPSQAGGNVSKSVSKWSSNSSGTRRRNTRKFSNTSPMPATSATWFTSFTSVVLIVLGLLLVLAILCCCIGYCRRGAAKDAADQEAWRSIEQPVTLFATMPLLDTFLADRYALESGAVRHNNLGALFYYLPPQTTLVKGRTGQLFHPPSGLLFNPINGYLIDQSGSTLINQSDHTQVAGNANLVYHPPTKRVYERCISMCSKATGSWLLANSPTGDDTVQMEPIRRARPDELPTKLHGQYSQLLTQWKHALQQREQAHSAQENRQAVAVAQPAPVVVVVNANDDRTPPSPRRHDGSRRYTLAMPQHHRRRPLMPEDMSDYEDAMSKIIPF